MDADFEALVEKELAALNYLVRVVLNIPNEEFIEYGSSALWLAMAEVENFTSEHEFSKNAQRNFDLLCDLTPDMLPPTEN